LNATTTTQTTLQSEYIHRAAWKAGVMGSVNVLASVLAVRLTLLVSVCGAISLAYLAVASANAYTLGGLAIYSAVVVVPLVWLTAAVSGR
jgi:hypothetical protein